MRIRIDHRSAYSYEKPVRGIVQLLRMTPRDHDGQHVRTWRIEPSGEAHLRSREDAFGNIVHVLSADGPRTELTIKVEGEVETSDTVGVARTIVERVPSLFFLRQTELTAPDSEIQRFAREAGGAEGENRLETLHRVLTSLAETMTFDDRPTEVTTKAAEAFGLKRGVCQDFTHIFIAASRHLGIPARYVSGYFCRNDGVIDQNAGHAWAEAEVPGLGWVGFDPANEICATDAHVRVAVGLDYLDAAPIRGARYGGGSERFNVQIRVDSARRQAQE